MRPFFPLRPLAAACIAFLGLVVMPQMVQAQELNIKVDEATIIKLDRPAKRIILGNPAIADVAAQSSTLLVLTGKSFGHTNMIVLDKNDDEILRRKIRVELSSAAALTLHRGSQRYSYACAPFCQSQLVMGDAPDYYQSNAQQIEQKFKVITNVMSGHSK